MKWSLKKGRASRKAKDAPKGSPSDMHPARDWLIGLGVASVVFLGGAAAIAYDFRVQFVLPPEITDVPQIRVTYSERDVTLYADNFKEKELRFEELRNTLERLPVLPPETDEGAEDETLAPAEASEYTEPTLSP